jgi:hypothetical protein
LLCLPAQSTPSVDDLYWEQADNGLRAVSRYWFDKCRHVVFTQEEWDEKQRVLKESCAGILKKCKKDIQWEKYPYTKAGLVEKGFVVSAEPTIVMVAVDGRFAVKYVYIPDWYVEAMLELVGYVYDGGKPMKARGMSDFGERGGTKGERGSMVMFGSHNLIPGKSHVREGFTNSLPALYRFNDPPNDQLDKLLSRHVTRLSLAESEVIPALAFQRFKLVEEMDPERTHRLVGCDAFSASLARHYVVTAHDDSGEAAETVLFANANGPLLAGHSWDFAVGGHVHPLPNKKGGGAILFIEGKSVVHGTLPTSATEPTLDHGNFGSALVTKKDMIDSLKRQRERKESTRPEWTAAYKRGRSEN